MAVVTQESFSPLPPLLTPLLFLHVIFRLVSSRSGCSAPARTAPGRRRPRIPIHAQAAAAPPIGAHAVGTAATERTGAAAPGNPAAAPAVPGEAQAALPAATAAHGQGGYGAWGTRNSKQGGSVLSAPLPEAGWDEAGHAHNPCSWSLCFTKEIFTKTMTHSPQLWGTFATCQPVSHTAEQIGLASLQGSTCPWKSLKSLSGIFSRNEGWGLACGSPEALRLSYVQCWAWRKHVVIEDRGAMGCPEISLSAPPEAGH